MFGNFPMKDNRFPIESLDSFELQYRSRVLETFLV